MIVVDSSVWIDYLNGRDTPETSSLDSFFGESLLIIGDLMLAEVLQGFRSDQDFRTAQRLLMSLSVVNMVNADMAIKSAANFRMLRKKGMTVRKTVDSIIATWCIENDFALLHSDKDFEPFHVHLGLKRVL